MTQQNSSDFDGIIDVAMDPAKKKAITLEMKQAIQAGRLRDALLCICKLVNVEPTDAVKNFQDPETASR